MYKTILFVSALVLLLTVGFFYAKPIEKQHTAITKKQQIAPTDTKKQQMTQPKMNTKHTSKPSPTRKTVPQTQHTDSHSQALLYESLSIEEAKLRTPTRHNITPIGAVRITQNISQLQPHDSLTLSDVEGEDYTLTIQYINQNDDGSTSTTASYEDEGIRYTSTITQSEKSNYITLSTANGLYEIETRFDTGYIYRTDTIRKQLQSRTPHDVIILPIPEE